MTWIKNNPVIFVLLFLIVIGIIIYFIRKNKSPENTTVVISDPSVFPLKYGSRGVEVQNLQRYLNDNNSCGLLPDGIFGKDTEKCVLDIFGTIEIDKTTYDKSIIAGSYNTVQGLITQIQNDLGGFFSGRQINGCTSLFQYLNVLQNNIYLLMNAINSGNFSGNDLDKLKFTLLQNQNTYNNVLISYNTCLAQSGAL